MKKEDKPWQPGDPQQICSRLAFKCADFARDAGVKNIYTCYCSFNIPVDAKLRAARRSEAAEIVNFEVFAATRDFTPEEMQQLQTEPPLREDISAKQELESLMHDVHNLCRHIAAESGFKALFKYKVRKRRSTQPLPEDNPMHLSAILQAAAGEEDEDTDPQTADLKDTDWFAGEGGSQAETAAGENPQPKRSGPVRRRMLLDEITLGRSEQSCGYLLLAVSRTAPPLQRQ